MTGEGYTITRSREGAGVVRVCPAGEFDIDNQGDLGDELLAAVRDPGVSHVVVDLSGSTFLGSSGLNELIVAYHVGLSLDKWVRVINPQPAVRRVFDVTGLTGLLIFD